MRGSETLNDAGFPVFAFRLHQFFSGGNVLAASLDASAHAVHLDQGQQYVPGSGRDRVLMPLAFCRECGQEYFPCAATRPTRANVLEPREISDRLRTDGQRNGYLYVSDDNPWPTDEAEQLALLPNDWLEAGGARVKRREPAATCRSTSRSRQTAHLHRRGLSGRFIPAPFRFCLELRHRVRQPPDGRLREARHASVPAGGARARRSSVCRRSASSAPTRRLRRRPASS